MRKVLAVVAAGFIATSLLSGCGSKLGDTTCEDYFNQAKNDTAQLEETTKLLMEENGISEDASATVGEDFVNELKQYCGFTETEYGFWGNVEKEAGVSNPTAKLKDFKYEG